MNQTEFIKQWAKEGDRIEDNKIRYNVYAVKGNEWLSVQVFKDYGNASFYIDYIEWQSPKIYSLKNSQEWQQPNSWGTGYSEEWRLVADYADVAKEEERIIESSVYEIIAKELSDGSQPAGNILLKLTSEIEKRLKALEDKLK